MLGLALSASSAQADPGDVPNDGLITSASELVQQRCGDSPALDPAFVPEPIDPNHPSWWPYEPMAERQAEVDAQVAAERASFDAHRAADQAEYDACAARQTKRYNDSQAQAARQNAEDAADAERGHGMLRRTATAVPLGAMPLRPALGQPQRPASCADPSPVAPTRAVAEPPTPSATAATSS